MIFFTSLNKDSGRNACFGSNICFSIEIRLSCFVHLIANFYQSMFGILFAENDLLRALQFICQTILESFEETLRFAPFVFFDKENLQKASEKHTS